MKPEKIVFLLLKNGKTFLPKQNTGTQKREWNNTSKK